MLPSLLSFFLESINNCQDKSCQYYRNNCVPDTCIAASANTCCSGIDALYGCKANRCQNVPNHNQKYCYPDRNCCQVSILIWCKWFEFYSEHLVYSLSYSLDILITIYNVRSYVTFTNSVLNTCEQYTHSISNNLSW